MSLKEMVQQTKYPRLKRFLDSNLGKQWDDVYSKICSLAAANTTAGRTLRREVGWQVDTTPAMRPYWRNHYYVDDSGILRKSDDGDTWKTHVRKKKETAPIVKIYFTDDGKDLWYECVEIILGPAASKYSTKSSAWFQFTRKYIRYTHPLFEYVDGKKGKQIGVEEIVREQIHKRQCNTKELKILRAVAARKIKISKLVYERGNTYPTYDAPNYLAAHVPGHFGKSGKR